MNYYPRKLITIAIACSFAAGSLAQAGPSGSTALRDNARLSVRRSADFETDIYLTLFIDGIQVTTLGQNEGYEATVRPWAARLVGKDDPESLWKDGV